MKFREIFRYEFAYQARRITTWLFFVAVGVIAFLFVRGGFLEDAMYSDFYVNSPFVIAVVSVFCSMFWLLTSAAVAGEIGSRDVGTGMHPLTYTQPVSKAEYLGGRFLAAFALNTGIMLAVPLGIMLAVYSPGIDERVIGPFRPVAYLSAFGFLALPNAFIGTAIQFTWSALGRRAILSYFGSVFLLFFAYGGMIAIIYFLQRQDYAALLDFFGHIYITSDVTMGWTPIEKSTRLIEIEGTLLWSRVIWVGVATGALTLTYLRFRFVHTAGSPWWIRVLRRLLAKPSAPHAPVPSGTTGAWRPISIPKIPRTFGITTYTRQTAAITWVSFRKIAKSPGGLVVLPVIAALIVLILPANMENMGTPLLPRTEYVLTFLTTHLTNPATLWVIIPLLTILYAGELVWREREAGLGEITDASPVPEWVLFLGKFLGLALMLVAWMVMFTVAGILVQVRLDYRPFEFGLYLQILFGLQLPEFLLFAALALVVQGVTTQKYVGHFIALIICVFIAFGSWLGIDHNLIRFGAAPAWKYTDMRGFGPTLGPWLWFMSYWAAWALLLVALATVLWVRGMDVSLRIRLKLMRRRFTPSTTFVSALAVALIILLGGFIFYNTNIMNDYRTRTEVMERRAEYERRYGKFKNIPQPHITGINLQMEIYPERGAVEVHGTYQLINGTPAAIDSIHVAINAGRATRAITFDRAVANGLTDDDLGHRIYTLKDPLLPGDSLQLSFDLLAEPHGFRNNGVDLSVVAKSTFFRSQELLPAIGYQTDRELLKITDRRTYGLDERPIIPTLEDVEPGEDVTGEVHGESNNGRISFEAVVGTIEDQIAVAPGKLRRTWLENGRRYFHYATDVPIGDEFAFFSAAYAVHEETWQNPDSTDHVVTVQIYHHPQHAVQLDRMLRSIRASLTNYTRAYGPYPFGYIRFVENPRNGIGMHSEASTVDYTEGFSRFAITKDDSASLDLPFAVVAHEMAHQWWGAQLPTARVEGAGLLTESPAWYSAMGVVEETKGLEHLRRLLRFFRQPYPIPPIRQSKPLLRGMDPYAAYRKGPFALYGLSEYVGKDKVDLAYRRLLEKHRSRTPPLPTSLDLFRELQAVTPDTLKYLVHDYFEANTVWELETAEPSAVKLDSGTWRVTIPVEARKLVVSEAGVETDVAMDEWIWIGVFSKNDESRDFGDEIYMQLHRIKSGKQTIMVNVSREPSDAGIDPYHLLIDLEPFDNVEVVEVER